MRASVSVTIVVLGVLISFWVHADTPVVVPESERKLASDKHLDGPTKTTGIASVTQLGSLDLGKDFSGMQGHHFRVRELVIEPGGIVAVHEHDSRPGVAYILEGEIIEHRNNKQAPILHKKGSTAFETSGVSHWWENKTKSNVRALVVDILPNKK